MPSPKRFLSFFLFLFVLLVGMLACSTGYCGIAEKMGAGEISAPIINKIISDPYVLIGVAIIVIVILSKGMNKDLTFLLTPLIALLSARISPTTTTLPTIPGLPPLVPTLPPTAPTIPPSTPSTTPILDYLPVLLQLLSTLRAKGDNETAEDIKRLIAKI